MNYVNQIQFQPDQAIQWGINILGSGAGNMMSTTMSAVSSIVSGLATFFIAFSFACYILFQKERLYIQVRKVIFAFISRQKAEAFLKICSLTYRTFANFLAGQCLEAIILGSMFVLKSRYRILGSSTGFVDCTKVLKNLFAMVHQCFDVFFWCGDRCYTIIFHQKIQNIRRQKRRK